MGLEGIVMLLSIIVFFQSIRIWRLESRMKGLTQSKSEISETR